MHIPASVQSIGESAFRDCKNLEKVTFAKDSQLKEIGEYAFRYCSSLKHISLPKNIEEIHKSCFYDSGLEEIVIPRNVKKIVENDYFDGVFSNCRNLRSVVFEQGSELTEIGERAFSERKSLLNICLPDKLKEIGERAFLSTGLTDVQIPASVQNIGEYAF